MAPIALEETWQTKRWANRIFSYLIATTEVNCNNGESAFGETEGTRPQLEFRRLLAKDLIYNHHVVLDDVSPRASKRLREQLGHELLHIPRAKKIQARDWWIQCLIMHSISAHAGENEFAHTVNALQEHSCASTALLLIVMRYQQLVKAWQNSANFFRDFLALLKL